MRVKEEGGGDALLVKEDVTAAVRGDITHGASSEVIWVELRNKKGMITLLEVYNRHPNSQQESEEQICQETAGSYMSNKVVVVGDFNFPNIDRECHSAKGLNPFFTGRRRKR